MVLPVANNGVSEMLKSISTSLRKFATGAVCALGLYGVSAAAQGRPDYPPAPRGETVDVYHGESVADPYRWLENPDSAQTRAWIEAQNKLAYGRLGQIAARPAIHKRMTELWNYERSGLPAKYGSRYFFMRNDGLQSQSALYVADTLGAPPRVLLDPNTLLADGTAALSGWVPSDDGKLLAYGIAEGGSDWITWRVRDVATGVDRPDVIRWTKFHNPAWLKDGSGFYYSRYDEPKARDQLMQVNTFNKLYFHKLGDAQAKDALVYHRANEKNWVFAPEITEDGRYLLVYVWRGAGAKGAYFVRDLQKPDAQMVELIGGFDSTYYFVGNEGGRFWFGTDWDAPLGRLVEIDLARPERANWKTIIAPGKQALQSVSLVGNRFFANYLDDASSRIAMFDLAGKPVGDVDAPALSTVRGFQGKRSSTETFYSVSNFLEPGAIYRYDVAAGTSSPFFKSKQTFDANRFETRQVFATSKDGTRVPMFLTYRRGLKLDGSNPALITGYGGFKISSTPGFSAEAIAFVEKGGVWGLVIMRGGDEYGQAWHEAGMFENKQNVFDDFIGAAEWLIANNYTRPDKLSMRGGSNSGLLVGAVMTQRPELFGAALPMVGVLDMLRFQHFTIGKAWADEYGSSDKPDQFRYLRAYSPLHNIRPGTKFPATLVTTGDHDDRVPPLHSYKFAAALQHAQSGDAPILIRVETRTGHGQGRPTGKQIDLATDQLAFLHQALGMAD